MGDDVSRMSQDLSGIAKGDGKSCYKGQKGLLQRKGQFIALVFHERL
jgi:ribosomal protein L15